MRELQYDHVQRLCPLASTDVSQHCAVELHERGHGHTVDDDSIPIVTLPAVYSQHIQLDANQDMRWKTSEGLEESVGDAEGLEAADDVAELST